jgi:hypothetical protein
MLTVKLIRKAKANLNRDQPTKEKQNKFFKNLRGSLINDLHCV